MLLDLANELLIHIYESCTSIVDVINLSFTCRRLHRLLPTSQRLPVFFLAAEAEFGPTQDIIQLVTFNSNQSAHYIREAPISYPLLRQVVQIGRVAQKWEEVYPSVKWQDNFADRRLLTSNERYRLRRAIYRVWLYDQAFHSRSHPRTARMIRSVVLERAELLHNWSTKHLAEIEDFRDILRAVIQTRICPSNGQVKRKVQAAFPSLDSHGVYSYHGTVSHHVPALYGEHFYTSQHGQRTELSLARLHSAIRNELSFEGWGDEVFHYYVVEDMLKLNPGQILWLQDNAHLKWQVEAFTKALGEWFDNNGETFGQTLDWVMGERSEDPCQVRRAIAEGHMGVAVTSTQ